MQHYIVTGTSRGIGQAIAAALFSTEHAIHGISRSGSPSLAEQARRSAMNYNDHTFDLSNVTEIPSLMDEVFDTIDVSSSHGLFLINNAGVLSPIRPIDRIDPAEYAHHLNVNLVAVMSLTAEFLKRTHEAPGPRTVAVISSGAAHTPYQGWSAYCTAKAGVEMFVKVAAAEQNNLSNPAHIFAVAPGVVDTAMQEQIRSSDERDFSEKNKFVALAADGKLSDPDAAALLVIRALTDRSIKNGSAVDVRKHYGAG